MKTRLIAGDALLIKKFLGILAVISKWLIGILLALIFVLNLVEADPGIAAAIIGVIGTTALAILTHAKTKEREINSRHFLEKKTAYMIFITLMFDLFKASKHNTEISDEEMLEKLFDFKRELMVWGDQNVIQQLEKYDDLAQGNYENKDLLYSVDDLLRAIRKDLGHNDEKLERGKLVSMFLTPQGRKELLSQ